MWFLLENHRLETKCFQLTVQVNWKKTGKMLLKEQMGLFYINCDDTFLHVLTALDINGLYNTFK